MVIEFVHILRDSTPALALFGWLVDSCLGLLLRQFLNPFLDVRDVVGQFPLRAMVSEHPDVAETNFRLVGCLKVVELIGFGAKVYRNTLHPLRQGEIR